MAIIPGADGPTAIFGGEGDAYVCTRGRAGRYAGAVPMRQAGGHTLVEITPSDRTANRHDAPGRPIRRDAIHAPISANVPF